MDHQHHAHTHDAAAPKMSGGCCGGKSAEQKERVAEARVQETAAEKPAKSGCCCNQN